jgi:hypothetical protein
VLATLAAAGVLAVAIYGYYRWENKRCDANMEANPVDQSDSSSDVTAWSGLTDK